MSNAYARQVMYGRQIFQDEKTSAIVVIECMLRMALEILQNHD